MARLTIEVDDDRLRRLEHLAARENRDVSELVRNAIDALLAAHQPDDEEWHDQLNRLVERVQRRIPPDIPPEEIEADITAARAEVRRERRKARNH
jgi:predicted transcriptional regulator